MPETSCPHLDQVHDVTPCTPQGCEECLKSGGRRVHLRLCLACGHVGRRDDAPGRHATRHFRATSHAIMRSVEPDEDRGRCFVDELFSEPAPVPRTGT